MYESDLADKKNTSTQYEELMRMIYYIKYIIYIYFNKISFVNIEINSLLKIMIYQV